jgi:hypothetical protein
MISHHVLNMREASDRIPDPTRLPITEHAPDCRETVAFESSYAPDEACESRAGKIDRVLMNRR